VFSQSDNKLVEKALKGNKKAWFELLTRHETAIYNYAIRMTGSSADAKDLMQEIFLSVFNGLQNFNRTGSFKAWLFKIAHYRCMDYFRRKQPNVSFDEVPELLQQDYAFSPESDMQTRQSKQDIHRAMQLLPINQRLVVELKFFSQFTFEEIADQLGISSNTVKTRLYAALGKLKSGLEVEHV
jgi:RNA polymerase sigma-70 factor (ECF subfamily)